eukprot:gene21453-27486_t
MHKHHADHFKRGGNQFEMGMSRALSLEGLATPSTTATGTGARISVTPVMIKIPPVTSHLELGDFENIPVFAWFMPYIVSSVPPQFMQILADLPTLFDATKAASPSHKKSAEDLLSSSGLSKGAASPLPVVTNNVKTTTTSPHNSPGRHRRNHSSTTYTELSRSTVQIPSDMYAQFAILDSPIPHSVLEKHKSFSTFTGFGSSHLLTRTPCPPVPTVPPSSFPASWKSLGLLWLSKDPTWRPWEVKLVYLLDNYLYEVTADGKVIIGFSPLCGATITRQSYRTSKRDKHLHAPAHHQTAPRQGGSPSNASHKTHPTPPALEAPTLSTVLMITCYTTSEVDVCPQATFYLTSQVKHSQENSESELTRIEAALLQASALTVHDIYNFDVKEQKVEESQSQSNSMKDFRSPSTPLKGLLGSVSQGGEQEDPDNDEDGRVLGRDRFTEVRLARRKPALELEEEYLSRAATPLSARKPVVTANTVPRVARPPPTSTNSISSSILKSTSSSQYDSKIAGSVGSGKNSRVRSGSNGSLSSIPESRRHSSITSSPSTNSLLNLISDAHSSSTTLHSHHDSECDSSDESVANSENESNYGEHNFEEVNSDGETETENRQAKRKTPSVERTITPPPHTLINNSNSGGENYTSPPLSINTPKNNTTISKLTPLTLPRATPTCAVKLISKELFWARVNTQQERTDALVREVLAQALLSRFYKIINTSHHMSAVNTVLPNIKKININKTSNVLGSATVGKKSTREELISKYHATMSLMTASAAFNTKENSNSNSNNMSHDDLALNMSRGKQNNSNSKHGHTPLSTQNSLTFSNNSTVHASNNPLPIVEIYHIFETIDGFAIELELMNSLDLFDKLSVEGPMSELQVSYITAQLVDAIAMCNQMGLAHRDVKLSNVTFPSNSSSSNSEDDDGSDCSDRDEHEERGRGTERERQHNQRRSSDSSSSDDEGPSFGTDSSHAQNNNANNNTALPYKSPYKPFNFSGDSPQVSTHNPASSSAPRTTNPRFNLQHSTVHTGTSFSQPQYESTKLLTVKLADFGMAGFLGSDRKIRGRCGTPGYVAPDILCAEKSGAYDINVDMFSIGVAAYTLLVGYEPFYGADNKELMEANKHVQFAFHSPDWDGVSEETKDFIAQCLQPSAETRITPEQAKKHPFVLQSFDVVKAHEDEKSEKKKVKIAPPSSIL